MKRKIPILFFILFALKAIATEQMPDLLLIDDETIYLKSFPLEVLDLKYRPFGLTRQTTPHTACWRGYQATWRLKNDTLFLERIQSCDLDGLKRDENIEKFFKKNDIKINVSRGKVIANWYNKDLIKYPVKYVQGINLYEPWEDDKPAENDVILRFRDGMLVLNRLNLKE